jgi:hydroxyacylglutathione hydrolase
LAELPELNAIPAPQLKELLGAGVIALDVRTGDQFAEAHVPGSVHIALSGQFASWAGTILGLSSRPVLIAETPEQISEARLRLARVGIEDVRGYLQGGIEAWQRTGSEIAQLPQTTVETLNDRWRSGKSQVLDVRREREWQAGHIEGASWWPLDNFRVSPPEIRRDAPLAVHCKSGYRSMIACSLLQRAGFQNVTNVIGGFDAWQHANLPVETGAAGGA